jgi:hypothetical protein
MINAPPTKQAPIEIRWVAFWILRRVSGLIRECCGATALSPRGSQTGAATTTITKTSSRARAHHATGTVPSGEQCATARGQSLIFAPTRCAISSPIPATPRDLPGTIRDQYQRERQVDATGGQIGREPLRRGCTHQTHCWDAKSDEAEDGPARKKEARGDACGLDDP